MKELELPNGMKIHYIDKLTANYVYKEIFEDNIYFKHGIQVKDGDTILDIGANIGMFTLYLSNIARDLSIYTFEPVPIIYQNLVQNLKILDKDDLNFNITNFNIGLGDSEKIMDIIYYPKVCADSAAIHFDWDYKVQKYVENYDDAVAKDMPIARIVPKFMRKFVVRTFLNSLYKGEKIPCKIRRLTDIIKENNIEKIDLMKLDAENAEKEVLTGLTDEDWNKIKQISMEVHTHIPGGENLLDEILDLLQSKGFTTYVDDDDVFSKLGVYMAYALKKQK